MNIQDRKGSDEAGIRSLIDQRVRAFYAKDAHGVMACLTADFVPFTLAPPLVSNMTDAGSYEAWFTNWRGPIETEILDFDVAISGDLGVSHSLNRMSGTSADGHEVNLWYRQTLTFRKTDEVWQIAHEHTSVPFYMDGSFRAAVDLKP